VSRQCPGDGRIQPYTNGNRNLAYFNRLRENLRQPKTARNASRCPFTAATPVRIRLGTPIFSKGSKTRNANCICAVPKDTETAPLEEQAEWVAFDEPEQLIARARRACSRTVQGSCAICRRQETSAPRSRDLPVAVDLRRLAGRCRIIPRAPPGHVPRCGGRSVVAAVAVRSPKALF
jgi:hypothetical protein